VFSCESNGCAWEKESGGEYLAQEHVAVIVVRWINDDDMWTLQ